MKKPTNKRRWSIKPEWTTETQESKEKTVRVWRYVLHQELELLDSIGYSPRNCYLAVILASDLNDSVGTHELDPILAGWRDWGAHKAPNPPSSKAVRAKLYRSRRSE